MVDFKGRTDCDSNGLPHKEAHRVLEDKTSFDPVPGHFLNPDLSRTTTVPCFQATFAAALQALTQKRLLWGASGASLQCYCSNVTIIEHASKDTSGGVFPYSELADYF